MAANRFHFRVWDKKNSRMWDCSDDEYYEYYVNLRGDILSAEEYLDYDWFTIAKYDDSEKRFVLMQSTGLTDKNGKEIFEGDIVNITKGFENFMDEVFYDEELRSIRLKGYLNDYCDFAGWIRGDFEFEVIGNIYKNQELLKKNKGINMLNELLKDLWNSNKEDYFRKAFLEIFLYKEESITVEEKALEYFIDDIKNLPYFFFNALKDCDSNDLKNILKG